MSLASFGSNGAFHSITFSNFCAGSVGVGVKETLPEGSSGGLTPSVTIDDAFIVVKFLNVIAPPNTTITVGACQPTSLVTQPLTNTSLAAIAVPGQCVSVNMEWEPCTVGINYNVTVEYSLIGDFCARSSGDDVCKQKFNREATAPPSTSTAPALRGKRAAALTMLFTTVLASVAHSIV